MALLLDDLQTYCDTGALEVVLTLNIPEDLPASLAHLRLPLKIIRNPSALGFGENHNRAFRQASGEFFCVLNPDLRLDSDVFPLLLAGLRDASVGVAAPLVLNQQGEIEDSARRFPTPLKLLCKLLGRCRGGDYAIADATVYPDWVGGMFMAFRQEVYRQMGGFNEKFFLYYEDVDLCARIWLRGLKVALIPQARVTHDARRSSHGNLRFLRMHVRSMLRFFLSGTCWRAIWLRRAR